MNKRNRRAWTAAAAGGGMLSLAGSEALAQKDPFDVKDARRDASAPPAKAPAGEPPSEGTEALSTACAYLTRETCAKSNTSLLATSAGYVVVLVLLMSVLRAWWDKRGTNSAVVRFLVPLLLGAAGAGTLVALDPLRGDDLACCLASAIFKAEIFLQDSMAGRAVLLGVLPSLLLFILTAVGIRLVRR